MLAVLWLIAIVFAVDLLLSMDVPQRIVAWVICILVAGWAFWRYTKPWVGVKEDLVDVALLVEKHQHIDSDLVAAIQFQQTDAAKWGSPQLESAVIDYVEEFSPSLNVFEGFTARRFKRRLAWLTGTLAVLIAAAVLFPEYAETFAHRMLLGSDRYPTETHIERIALNGKTVYLPGEKSVTITCAYGTPLNFEVLCRGTLPEKGRIRLVTKDQDSEVDIELHRGLAAERAMAGDPKIAAEKLPQSSSTQSKPADEITEPAAETKGEALYHGELPRLVNSVTYQVYMGDTWSAPLKIKVIPLPVVTVTLDPQPPAYAVSQAEEEAETIREGTRQIAVVEGTSVAVNLQSNNKPLAEAVLIVEEKSYPLAKQDKQGRRWSLGGPRSPLYEIRQPIRYMIQVKDEAGLTLERPIEGTIRIRADRKPRIQPPVLEVPLVRPIAITPIEYDITDDYGLSRLLLKVQVVRKLPMQKAGAEEMLDQVDHFTREIKTVSAKQQPIRSLSGTYLLELEDFNVNPGDELKVTLEALDYRGTFEPQSSISEPFVLKVTDRQGVLLTSEVLDQKSSNSLGDMIKVYTGDKK